MADALHLRCQAAVAEAARGLDLEGIPPERVYEHGGGDQGLANVQFPCVLVSIPGGPDEAVAWSTEQDEYAYPVQVVALDRDAKSHHARRGKYLLWRQTLLRAFHSKRLGGVPENYGLDVTPEVVLDDMLPSYCILATGFTVACRCVVERGFEVA